MRTTPPWYPQAVPLLAAGETIKTTAAALGIGEKTVRRHLAAPGSVLKAQVEEARATETQSVQDELGPLRGKALAVLERALDAGDVGAAKALLTKLVATPDAPPPEERQPEPEISPEKAAREVALSLPAFADLARMKLLDTDAVETLRTAARAFLADDFQSRSSPDPEAGRVDPGSLTPPGGSFDNEPVLAIEPYSTAAIPILS